MPMPKIVKAVGEIESLGLNDEDPDTKGVDQINGKASHAAEDDTTAEDTTNKDSQADLRDADGGGHGKKKRRPKKKAKHLPMLPAVLAVQDQLAWKLEQTTRLGRHAVAKHALAPGQLVLRERAVATAVRSTYTSSTCHTCLKEMPSGTGAVQVATALLQGSQQYKQYCSPACAMGDTHAALTAPVHGRIGAIAAKTQVEIELLHLLLELDSRNAAPPPPVHVRTDPSEGWILEASPVLAADNAYRHGCSNGHEHCGCGPAVEQASKEHAKKQLPKEPALPPTPEKSEARVEPPKGDDSEQQQLQQQEGPVAPSSKDAPTVPEASESRPKGKSEASPQPVGGNAEPPELQCTLDDVFMLVAHGETSRPEWREAVAKGAEALQQAITNSKTFKPCSLQQYMALAALINNNSHGTGAANSSNTDRGFGVYPALSMFNHSCRPNCIFASKGPIIEVRVIRDVKKGEQLTVSYVNMTEPRKIRTVELLATKHFICHCERCTEPVEGTPDMMLEDAVMTQDSPETERRQGMRAGIVQKAVKCRQGKCQGFLLEQRPNNITDGRHWVCTACARSVPSHPPSGSSSLRPRAADTSIIYPAALQDKFKRLWNEAVAISNQKGRAAAKPAFERLLTLAQEALHPMHVTVIDCLMPLVNCARATQDAPDAIRYLQLLLPAIETMYGCQTVELGNLYGLLGSLYAERASSQPGALQSRYKKQAKEAWSKAQVAFSTCLGESHDLCQEQQARLRGLR